MSRSRPWNAAWPCSRNATTRQCRPTGEVILGVDTHRDTHVAAVLSPLGAVFDTEEFPASAAGYRGLLAWAGALGTVWRAGVEGTGSFGAALSRYLLTQGVEVFEVNRPDRTDRRLHGSFLIAVAGVIRSATAQRRQVAAPSPPSTPSAT
ncbi:IS110 family transposase [Streptomyces nigrescens]